MTDDVRMVPQHEGADLQTALIRAVGFDKLSEPQRELALAVAKRYELDPMLKHLVMIDGKPYITRDGLLHVAHRSNDFDGIEVTDPVLDAEPDSKGRRYWRSRATVWRKSFGRPFVYPGRYPQLGGNEKYAEEMSIKVAEVMTLRRAFDVAAPTQEERWEDDEDLPEQPAQPTSLAERVAQRAAEIAQVAPDAEESSQSDASAPVVVTVTAPEPEPVREPKSSDELDEEEAEEARTGSSLTREPEVIEERRFVAPAGGFGAPAAMPEMAKPTDDAKALEAFSTWAASQDVTLIKAVAKRLFPSVHRFRDLEAAQLDQIVAEVTREVAAAEEAEEQESEEELLAEIDQVTADQVVGAALTGVVEGIDELASRVAPDAEDSSPSDAGSGAMGAGGEPETTAPEPFTKPTLCGEASPLSGSTCTMDAGHKGAHRAGLREAW